MTLKKWVEGRLADGTILADEVVRHGCQAGFPGLTYYHETCLLHDQHEDEIWDLVYDHSRNYGEDNVVSYIASWNGSQNVGSLAQLKNLLVWYAVEHYCQGVLDATEEVTADEAC